MIIDFYPSTLFAHKFGKFVVYIWNLISLIVIFNLINDLSIKSDLTFSFNVDNGKSAPSWAIPMSIAAGIGLYIFLKRAATRVSFDNNQIKVFNCWNKILREFSSSEIKKIEFKGTKLARRIEKKNKNYYFPKDLWISLSKDYVLKLPWQMENYTILVKQIEKWSGIYLPAGEVNWLEKNRGNSEYFNSYPEFKSRKDN